MPRKMCYNTQELSLIALQSPTVYIRNVYFTLAVGSSNVVKCMVR